MRLRSLAPWLVCVGCASAAPQTARSAVEVATPPPVPGCIPGPTITVGPAPVEDAREPEVPMNHFDHLAGEVRARATRCRAASPDGAGALRASLAVMPNGEIGRLEIDADASLPPALVACTTQEIATIVTDRPHLCEARTTVVVRF